MAGLLALPTLKEPIHAAPHAHLAAAGAGQAPAAGQADPGAAVYAKTCAMCHGAERQGNLPVFPPLVGIQRQMTNDQILDVIHNGKGKMPAVKTLSKDEETAVVHFLTTPAPAPQAPADAAAGGAGGPRTEEARAGGQLFQQNCAFCHGRDAMGGETGPDLTRSKLVLEDKTGDAIMGVIREGRVEKKMPAFNFSTPELTSLVAFIRYRITAAAAMKGGRRGVDVSDLQTGNAQAGQAYFNGAGGCSKCHSPTGDLAGIATRLTGLRLEEQMLYPRNPKSTVKVTLSSGQSYSGELAYLDEFTVGLKDSDGVYHSWSTALVKYTVDSPVEAHVAQFPKYTDDDIHNLMAYLQTLK